MPTWASWRQISVHATPEGARCRWSEVSLREGAPFRGCPEGCTDARAELVEREVPWQDSRFDGEDDLGAVA